MSLVIIYLNAILFNCYNISQIDLSNISSPIELYASILILYCKDSDCLKFLKWHLSETFICWYCLILVLRCLWKQMFRCSYLYRLNWLIQFEYHIDACILFDSCTLQWKGLIENCVFIKNFEALDLTLRSLFLSENRFYLDIEIFYRSWLMDVERGH